VKFWLQENKIPSLGCTLIRRDLGRVGILFLLSLTITGCGGKATVNGTGGPTSVSITSAPSSVDPADSTTITAVVANDSKNLGVSWSLSGAGTLSNQTTTSATYTAPGASSSPVTVTVTATSRLEETRTATTQITIPVVPTVTSTNSGMAGAVGSAYSAQLSGAGGITPYTWAVTSGNLPAGLSLSSAGLITGTPQAAAGGTTNVTFQLKDAGSPTALTAAKTLAVAITPAPAITFTGVMPATGSYNQTYAGSAAATGGLGTLTYSVASGALPTGLTLNATNGAVTGKTTVAGTYNFTIQAYDTFGDAASHAYQVIVVAPSLIVTPNAGALPFAVTGHTYSQTLTVSGGTGTGYTWVVSGLSNGLTYSANGAALTINGPATTTGTVNFVATATDSVGDTSSPLSYSIPVYAPLALPITIPATLPSGAAVGVPYSGTVVATGGGGNYTWTVTGQSDGLTTSSSGGTLSVSGTPTATGTVSLNVSVKDTTTNTTVGPYTYVITVYSAVTLPAPNPSSLGIAVVNNHYSGTVVASGGSGNFAWTVTGLPSDNLNYGGAGATLTISGTPTIATSVTFTASVKDTSTNATAGPFTYTTTVNPALALPTPNPTSLSSQATIGTAYSGTVMASGGSGTGYTYTVTGLPANGLNYSSAGGVLTISGTPTSATAVSFGVSVKDSFGLTAGPVTYTITSYAALTLPNPDPATLGPATLSLPYTGTIVAAGGSGNYTWTVTGLPSDSLNYTTAGGTLTVTGTPATATVVSLGVSITDTTTHNTVGPFTYTIPVYSSVTLPAPNPVSLGPADAGSPYSGTIVAAGGSGNYSWTVAGLPYDGLNFAANGATLTISGTPTTQGTVSINVSVKDTSTNTAVGPFTYTITVYGALALPAPDPASLPGGYVNIPYTGTVAASGGSGNYSWQVTGLSDNLTSATSAGTLTVSGTPGATPATVTFGVKLTDTATNNSVTQPAYTIAVVVPTPVSLPAPNPATLPFATTNQAYTGSINAAGGVPPFTWSVNGVSIPNTGAAVAIADGLSVSNNGTNVLSVSGTPTAIQTVNLTNVKVTDSIGSTQTVSYTIAVYRTSQVSGQISLSATCGTGSPAVPTITVKLLSSPGNTVVATTTTDSSGNYTFPSVLAGTYTISPSITGPSSLFYPATQSVTLANTDANGIGFTVSLGYTVSGTVSYSGANTGQIYLALVPATPCGAGGEGTSIFTPGSFTIRGVPPGNYNLQAWMDLTALANGAQNTSDPTGTLAVSVVSANLTGQSVTLADNTPSAVPAANPTIKAIAPTDQGVAISYKPVSSNGVEAATSYDVQWSTSSTFATGNVIHNFKAVGQGSNVWILNNGTAGVTGNPLTNGQTYYFEARARNSAGAASGWTVYGGSTPVGITIGASTTGNEVQGTVTIPAGVTATGPLYVGYYNQSTNTVYGTRIASPSGSNPFTVYVPTDSSNDYVFFEILDQNNDGLIDAGDVANVRQQSLNPIAITGPLTGQNLTVGTSNSTAQVGTQYYQLGVNNPTTGYNLNFDVREANKLPVAVTLLSGPNIINPVDISNYCQGCGSTQFQYYVPLNGNTPNVGDAYTLKVTYSDSSSDTETLTPAVTGWNGTTALVGANDVATSLLPNDQESLRPTFTWNVPAVDSNDTFSYYLFDANNNIVWQIPGQNSSSNGLPSSVTSLNWGIDPTDPNNDLTSGFTLTDQAFYSWQLNALDAYGNQALTSVTFQASGFL
jgi:hypothetical protein